MSPVREGGRGVRDTGRRGVRGRALMLLCLLCGIAVGCSGSGTALSKRRSSAGRPNVVFVLTDDLDNTTEPFWDAMPQTKALIADRGVNFPNAFTTNPVCCPARATLLTGTYSHNNGVFDHTPPDGGYAAFVKSGAEQDTLATRMEKSGYRTAFVGKYLNGYEETPKKVPPGWDEWFGLAGTYLDGYTYTANHNGTMEKYGSKPTDYQTDVLSREAKTFVNATEHDDHQPFLLYLAPSAPHSTIAAAPRDRRNAWSNAAPKQLPNYDEADVSDKPSWLRLGKPLLGAQGTVALTQRYQASMGSLLAVDDMVASLARDLKAKGEFHNTVFVFASDNGNSFGAHRMVNKQVPYEESIRVPLAIAGPSIRQGNNDAMVAQIDYVPTVLDLAGIHAGDLDGRSLVPLLRGKRAPWRDDLLIEYHGTYNAYYDVDTYAQVRAITASGPRILGPPTYRALRNQRYLYVEWYRGAKHEYELYDLRADPYELDNLVPDTAALQAYAGVIDPLKARTETLSTCKGRSCRT